MLKKLAIKLAGKYIKKRIDSLDTSVSRTKITAIISVIGFGVIVVASNFDFNVDMHNGVYAIVLSVIAYFIRSSIDSVMEYLNELEKKFDANAKDDPILIEAKKIINSLNEKK